MSHNKKYKKYKTKYRKFICSTLDTTEKKTISEIISDCWDEMKRKTWINEYINYKK